MELENEFLAMSKARREEIGKSSIRSEYLEKLAKSKSILPPDNFFVAEDIQGDFGVPWL